MFETLNQLRVIFGRRDKFFLLFLTLLTAISALWEVTGIGLIIPVVAAVVNWDLMEQNIYLKIFYQWSPFKEHGSFMIFTAALVVMNFAVKNIFNYLVLRLQSNFIYRKQRELSVRLFRTFMGTDYQFFLDHTPAELNAGILRVKLACEGTLMPFMLVCSDFMVVAALVGAVLWFMPLYLTAAMVVLIILALIFYLPFRKLNSSMSEDYVKFDNAVNADMLEVFSGAKTIKSCAKNEFFIRRFDQNIRKFTQAASRIYIFGQLPRLGLEFLAVAMAMGIFIAMILGKVPTGSVVLYFALLVAAIGRILPTLSRMQYNMTRLRQVRKTFDELYENLTMIRPEQIPGADKLECKCHLEQAVEIRDLFFSYPDGKKVFEKFDLVIPAHTSLALVGPTGGGKTTLADLLIGLLKPDSGEILFDGVRLEEALDAVRAITAYVPQQVFLLDGSIRENVALGLDPGLIDDARLGKALAMAHLTDWIKSLPDGVETNVGGGGVRLSGGQRQRIGIARALYANAELLIFDEATSALDSTAENAVVEALETLHGQKTMIVIAHRKSTIEHCDRVVEIGK